MGIKQRGVIHLHVLVILLVVALSTAVLVNYSNPNHSDVKGTLIAKSDDEDDNSSGSSDSSGSRSSESTPKIESKTTTTEGVRIETKTKEDEQKTEVRFGEGERIKTKIKEGKTEIKVISGGIKVKYEIKDGKVTIKAEREDGDQEIAEEEIIKIVDRLDKTGIKVATAGGKLVVTRNQIGAVSNFPLQVDLNTNELIVNTPAGTRRVTVLPDAAVQNMLAANVISRLGPQALAEAATVGQVATISGIIQLGIRNNLPVYEVPGVRDFRLLGFIPIPAPVTAIVSAETGQLVTTDQPLITRIIDLLSP